MSTVIEVLKELQENEDLMRLNLLVPISNG
jgi:hypothetical protein